MMIVPILVFLVLGVILASYSISKSLKDDFTKDNYPVNSRAYRRNRPIEPVHYIGLDVKTFGIMRRAGYPKLSYKQKMRNKCQR